MKSITKTETEVLKIEFEYARALETKWRSGTGYSVGAYVRPSVPNGFEYECTNAGQSSVREPSWPTTVAASPAASSSIVTDGSVEWTCRDFGTNATDTISSVSITAETGLTISGITNGSTTTQFNVSAGSRGNSYVVSVEATSSASEVIEDKIRITVSGD